MKRHCTGPVVVALLVAATLFAVQFAGLQIAAAQTRPAGRKGLPQEHEYQKQLRAYMATLSAADFEPVRGKAIEVAANPNADEQLRMWVLSLDPVRIGGKRASPSVNLPSAQFTLRYIESPTDEKVMQPMVWAEPLVWLANWKYPGNPYFGSKALKLRAFVFAVQDLMMIDEQQEHTDAPMFHRADWFSPHLLMYAYTYAGVKDVLPDAPRKAFEAGLKKMVLRVNGWGPRGEETFLDIQAALAMAILHESLDDAELKPLLEAYVKRFMTAGEYYNPAGYFADQGCFDTGFNGLTLYFATWLAARTDWPWAKESAAQAWKLRGYLMLPEPGDDPKLGKRLLLSPTHTTLRTSSAVAYDQWNWPYKFVSAAYLTDDALCQTQWPTAEEVKGGPAGAVGGLNAGLHQNPQDPAAKVSGIYIKDENLQSTPWVWRLWPDSPVFPMVNYGYDHYPQGFAARLAELRAKNSPLLKLPFERSGTFIEQFDKGFLIAKAANYGVIIHTGPVSEYKGPENFEYSPAPYGLGGGTLSAFWTPAMGSAILGRRGGMNNHGDVQIFDKVNEWRNWPVQAVIGSTGGDRFFTSARIQKPESTYEIKGDQATVKVGGVISAAPLGRDKSLAGKLEYARTFNVAPGAVRIETSVKGDGVDKLTELYEAIPAFHREGSIEPETVLAKIEFQTGGAWTEAAPTYTDKVTAIRITRFGGAALVKLDRPRRVKLSPGEMSQGFLTGGVSRNILIDLLESNDQPLAIKDAKTIGYEIAPMTK